MNIYLIGGYVELGLLIILDFCAGYGLGTLIYYALR